MDSVKDKVILVTGGARGLGKAICENLNEGGAIVIPADIRGDELEEVARNLDQNDHKKVKSIVLDICDEKQIEKAIRDIVEEYGRLDVLINNAGTDKTVSIEELDISDWDQVLGVNLRGPFIFSKFALPVMRKQGGGYIINVASTAAKRAWANAAAYHASKWGLLGFSHALHVEGRPQNIKVTAVVTGGMRTPFLLERFPDIDIETLQDPANVANAVRFALSQPEGTVIPELMVLPMRETSWP